jgi:hypothetical protein
MQRYLLQILALLLLAPAARADDRGLLAHWTMDEASEGIVRDATGRRHDATFHATGTARPVLEPGIIGKALRLREGEQAFLSVANFADLMPPKGLTAMAWIKPSARNKTYEILCAKGDKSGQPPWPGWRLRFHWTRAQFQYGTADGKEPRVESAAWSVPAGFWSHIAAVHNGTSMRLYINGVEKAVAPVEGEIMPSKRGLIIGNYIGRKNAYAFDGLLDDVKVFGRALTAEEVFAEAVRGLK